MNGTTLRPSKGRVSSNKSFERTVGRGGPRLARHGGPYAAAQLGR